jgi:hypothetical protein
VSFECFVGHSDCVIKATGRTLNRACFRESETVNYRAVIVRSGDGMADMRVLEARAVRRAGSSPVPSTIYFGSDAEIDDVILDDAILDDAIAVT